MQIDLGKLVQEYRTAEQQLGADVMKAFGLSGSGFDNFALMDIFGAPGHSAVGTSAMRDIEQVRGWNFTAILAKALQFGLGSMAVYCPQWIAEAICDQHGIEYKASKRVTGTEQYGVPEDWVTAPAQHRIAALLKSPNPWRDEATFLFEIAEQTNIHGVAHILVLPNAAGMPKELWVIPKAAIQPVAPSAMFPEGSYRIGHLSKLSINTQVDDQPLSLQQALARISNREYSAKYIIPIGLPSPLFVDDFLNSSSAISDTVDTDAVIHRTRRNMLEKLMTTGPRLEPMPGVTVSNSEWVKLIEEFESQNLGPNNQGNAWRPPSGIKVTNDSHTGREMEFVQSADQSRDHTLGQHLLSSAMLGLGAGGSYAQVVGLIKGNARLILQPLMRIYSGQLTIGLRRFMESPQNQFMALLQAANIDDPEQRRSEWDLLMKAKAVKVKEVREAFNMMPLGSDEDDKMAGEDQAAGMGGYENYGYETDPGYAPESQTNSGQPETPGIGAPESPAAESTESLKNTGATEAPGLGKMSRREFMRHSKNIGDIVEKYRDGKFGEKTAHLMLQTLGLSKEMAQEFVDSVKDPRAEQSMSHSENQTTASALFSRAVQIRSGTFTSKSLIDDQARTAATHPDNMLRIPCEKDLKAGIYRKGRLKLCGLMIEIENPAGSVRSGRRPDGSRWAVEMQDHYGYIVGAVGFDKDQLDVFIKTGTEPDFNGMIFVINQANADGSFDEHKCFMGCASKSEAIKRYLDNYDDDLSDRIMSVAPLPVARFKEWLIDPDGGPMAGPLHPQDALKYMTLSTEPGIAGSVFERSLSIKAAKPQMSMEEINQPSMTVDDTDEVDEDDPQEKAELIADILVSLYGDETESLLDDGEDFDKLAGAFAKAFNGGGMFKETTTGRRTSRAPGVDPRDGDGDGVIFDGTSREQPAGARPERRGGRRPKNSPEQIAQIHADVQSALKGERSAKSAKELAESLSTLTVKQLRDIKLKYELKASGRTKQELVDKIAKRLDAGRRADHSPSTIVERQAAATRSSVQSIQVEPNAVRDGNVDGMRSRRDALRASAAENAAVAQDMAAIGRTTPAERHERMANILNESADLVDASKQGALTARNRFEEDARAEAERHTAEARERSIRQQAAQNQAAQRTSQAEDASRRVNAVSPSNDQLMMETALEAANLHRQAAEEHQALGNTEQASRHTRDASNAQFLSDDARQRRENTLRREVENQVMTHMNANPTATMRDLATVTQIEPGPSDNPLSSRLNQALVSMVRDGRIVAQDRQFGGPLFSLPQRQGTATTSDDVSNAIAANRAEQRLAGLKRNLPAKFIIANNEDGKAILVSPNDRTRILPDDPAKQVEVIEAQLRRRGFNPDEVVAGTVPRYRSGKPAAKATPTAAPAPAAEPASEPAAPQRRGPLTADQRTALKKIGADFLDDIEPDADGNLIQAIPSKARVVINEAGARIPQSWDEVPVDDQARIRESFSQEVRRTLRTSAAWRVEIRERAKTAINSELDSMTSEQVANAILPMMRQRVGLEKANVEDVKAMLDTGEELAAQTKQRWRNNAVTMGLVEKLDGRRSWMRQQYAAAVKDRIDTASQDQLYRHGQGKNMMSAQGARRTSELLRQFGMTQQDLASVIGARDDWQVTVTPSDYNGGSLNISVHNGTARMSRQIYKQDGQMHLYNSSFFMDDNAPKGLGLQIFSQAIANAKRLGFAQVKTMPCRSDSMVGYAVWPQFGYDADISDISDRDVMQRTRQQYPQARTIRDIYDTPGGQEWWWANGTSLDTAKFDLTSGSRNMVALQNYMKKKKSQRDRVRSSAQPTA